MFRLINRVSREIQLKKGCISHRKNFFSAEAVKIDQVNNKNKTFFINFNA